MAVLALIALASPVRLHPNDEIVWIEETVSQSDRARSFYGDVLQFDSKGETRDPAGTTAAMRLGEETLCRWLVDS